jgi:hypothetical protein
VHPDDARSTVASLTELAECLPQAFDHLLELVLIGTAAAQGA